MCDCGCTIITDKQYSNNSVWLFPTTLYFHIIIMFIHMEKQAPHVVVVLFFFITSTQLYTISTLLTQINQCISSTTITHAFPYRKKAKHQTQMLANACKNAHNYEKPKYFSSFHSSMLSFSINMTSSQDITVMAGSNGNTRHSSLTKPMPMRKNL